MDSNAVMKKTGRKFEAGMERQIFMSFSPLSLVWVPSIRRHSQHPCPKLGIAAWLYNIYNAYILKQRSIGATSETHLLPAKVGAKYGLDITSSKRGTGGFEFGGELSETGRAGFSRGRPAVS